VDVSMVDLVDRLHRTITLEPNTDPISQGVTNVGTGGTVVPNPIRVRDVIHTLLDEAGIPEGDRDVRLGPMLDRDIRATPYLENRNIMDLLGEIARAQAAAMWLSPDGVFHYVHPDVLEAQAPTATITADVDLLDIAWSTSVRDARRRVRVVCRDPEVTASPNRDVVLWEGPREAVEHGERAVDIATPDGDTDWLGAGGQVFDVTSAFWPNRTRRGIGTMVGATWQEDNGEGWVNVSGNNYATFHGSPITSQAYRFLCQVASSGIPSDRTIVKHFPTNDHRGDALPVLRGTGKIKWTTSTHTATTTGPEVAADYDHDAGPWVQGDACQDLANWLGERMTQPRPLIQELPIAYRPDLDLGQVITLVEDQVYDITLTCLVIGLRERHTPETGAQMWVTLRVLDDEPPTEG